MSAAPVEQERKQRPRRINSLTTIYIQYVSETRVCDFIRTQISVKNWIEEVLDLKGKLDDDLFKSLKNGVFLCYLMEEIEPRSIPQVHQNTNQEFKLKENITFFLAALKDFGIPNHQIFSIGDLWDEENIVNVVLCLASLAELAVQRGFSIPLKPIKPENEYSDSNIMKKLSDNKIAEIRYCLGKRGEQKKSVRIKVSTAIFKKRLALLVGNEGNLVKLEKGFTRFQALFRGYQARQFFKKRKRDLAYRGNVAQEILDTEKQYVRSLELCIKHYQRPLENAIKEKKPILPPDKLKILFCDMELILKLNSVLLNDIESVISKWNNGVTYQNLGKIFVSIVDFLKIYKDYVQNFNRMLEVYTEYNNKSSFRKFLQETHSIPELNSLDLPSYLIMPVQRIPRYNLLLKDLVKHTWKDHPDYEKLASALEKIAGVAEYLNEQKRDAEELKNIVSIQSVIRGSKVPYLPQVGRKYIRHGLLEDAKHGPLVFYLFNNLLIYGVKDKKFMLFRVVSVPSTKKNSELILDPMKFKDVIPLEEITINDTLDSTVFEIVKIGSKKPLFCLSTKNKELWVKDLRTAIERVQNESRKSKIFTEPEEPPKEEKLIELTEEKSLANLKEAEEVLKMRSSTKTSSGKPAPFKGVHRNYSTMRNRSSTLDGSQSIRIFHEQKNQESELQNLLIQKKDLEEDIKKLELQLKPSTPNDLTPKSDSPKKTLFRSSSSILFGSFKSKEKEKEKEKGKEKELTLQLETLKFNLNKVEEEIQILTTEKLSKKPSTNRGRIDRESFFTKSTGNQ